MKVVLINHSDSKGGASVVSYRLVKALRSLGVEASMLVVHKATDDDWVVCAAPRWRARLPFYAETAKIYVANGFRRDGIFSLSIGGDGLPLSRHPLVRDADAVLLAWVNQGMLSLGEISRIASRKPLVWTMHDMWCLTALCHHAGTCTRYHDPEGCRKCPMLDARADFSDLAANIWYAKQRLYGETDIRFVAVSNWLRDRCLDSRLMDSQSISVIPNAFPVEEFYSAPVAGGKKIILMGAARLDDPIKGLPYAVEALNKLGEADAEAVFFGALRNPGALDGLRFPHRYIGPVADPDKLHRLFASAHAVISTSLYETLPGTLIEGQAAGAMPVSFDRGGQADIIRSDNDGRLVHFGNTDAFASALAEVIATDHNRQALRATVAERFSAEAVARQYIDMLSGITNH